MRPDLPLNHPSAIRVFRAWLYRRWTRTRVLDKGTANIVKLYDSLLQGCTVEVIGNNNSVEILPRARLWGVTVRLVGEGLFCRIGSGCRLHGGQYLLEDN